jgi:alpha-beta hydrolase superfamily lysophospholipase
MKRRSERVRFEGAFGDLLAARVDLPAGEPMAIALFAHCFTCSKDLKPIVRISRALAELDIGVVRFDFTGIGESAGDFADTNFTSNLEDLVAAAGFVGREYGGPQLLIGHSLGGAAVLAAAHRVPEARLVATIAAPSDTGHLSETLLRQAPELETEGEAEVVLAGRRVRIRRQLIDDLDEQSMSERIAGLDRPLLLFHSPADRVIDIEHAERIFELARHPKSLVSLDGADHLLLEHREDAIFVADTLATWARRYLP